MDRPSQRPLNARQGDGREADVDSVIEALTHLAGSIAHRSNNNLMALEGCLYLLQTDPGTATRRLRQIMSATRDFNRELMGLDRYRRMDPETLELDRCLSETEVLWRSILGSNIRFELVLAAEGSTVSVGSGPLLSAVLQLLRMVQTSIRATEGTIRMETGRRSGGDEVEIQLRAFLGSADEAAGDEDPDKLSERLAEPEVELAKELVRRIGGRLELPPGEPRLAVVLPIIDERRS